VGGDLEINEDIINRTLFGEGSSLTAFGHKSIENLLQLVSKNDPGVSYMVLTVDTQSEEESQWYKEIIFSWSEKRLTLIVTDPEHCPDSDGIVQIRAYDHRRAKPVQDKPVFDYLFSYKECNEIVDYLTGEHPESWKDYDFDAGEAYKVVEMLRDYYKDKRLIDPRYRQCTCGHNFQKGDYGTGENEQGSPKCYQCFRGRFIGKPTGIQDFLRKNPELGKFTDQYLERVKRVFSVYQFDCKYLEDSNRLNVWFRSRSPKEKIHYHVQRFEKDSFSPEEQVYLKYFLFGGARVEMQ
jgi:hypothetical protein